MVGRGRQPPPPIVAHAAGSGARMVDLRMLVAAALWMIASALVPLQADEAAKPGPNSAAQGQATSEQQAGAAIDGQKLFAGVCGSVTRMAAARRAKAPSSPAASGAMSSSSTASSTASQVGCRRSARSATSGSSESWSISAASNLEGSRRTQTEKRVDPTSSPRSGAGFVGRGRARRRLCRDGACAPARGHPGRGRHLAVCGAECPAVRQQAR